MIGRKIKFYNYFESRVNTIEREKLGSTRNREEIIMAKNLNPIIGEKLTKKFFLNLEQGLYLTSNCYEVPGKPAFASKVAPLSQRSEQWKKIVKVRADQRLCNVFENENDHKKWFAAVYC